MKDLYKKSKSFFWDSLLELHPSIHTAVFRFRVLIKYVFSGGMGAVANLGSLAILVEKGGLHYLPASMLAFLFGFFTSFILQKFFTFGDMAVKALHRQLVMYFVIAVTNLGLNTFMVYLFTERAGMWYFFSQLLSGLIIAGWSFFLYRVLVFRKDGQTLLIRPFFLAALALGAMIIALYLPSFLHMRELSDEQEARGIAKTLPVYGSDSAGFIALAETLRESGNFGYRPGHFDTFRTPGYPALLVGWKGLFGSYDLFPILQIVLVYVTSLLLFSIGMKLFSPSVGALAAGIFAVDPNTLYHSLTILSETPYLFFLTLSIFLVIVRPRLPIHAVFAAGIVLGIATLIKPVSLYLPAVFLVYFLIAGWHERKGRSWFSRSLLSFLIFLLAFVATLLPWIMRNQHISSVTGLSSVSAFNLFHYTVPEFLSFREGITPDDGRKMLQEKLSFPLSELSDISHSQEIQRIALSYITRDPLQFSYFYAVKSIPFFFSSSLDNLFVTYNDVHGETVFSPSIANLTNLLLSGDIRGISRELASHPTVALEQILLGALFIFMLIGVAAHRRNPGAWVLFFSVVYFSAVTGVVAYARLRIPAMPGLALLASAGFLATMRFIWLCIKRDSSPLLSPHSMKKEPSISHSRESLPLPSQKE